MSRPFLLATDADSPKLMAQGYAIVAVLEKFLPSGAFVSRDYVGER